MPGQRGPLYMTSGLALGVGLTALVATLVAGPLSPPFGPVAPTYKTLADVEPRVPVSAATTPGDSNSVFRITAPGAYYLTTSVKGVANRHGIEIAVSGVHLDLNGFAVIGVPGSLTGVNVEAFVPNVTVRNGSVLQWGQSGVVLRSDGGSVRDVLTSDNGVYGISLDGSFGATISGCNAVFNGQSGTGGGIRAGTGAVVSECAAQANVGPGFIIASGVIRGCTASSNGGEGIVLGAGVAEACVVRSNTLAGIRISDFDGRVSGCSITNNGASGINAAQSAGVHAAQGRATIEHNHIATNAGFGVVLTGAGSVVVANAFAGNPSGTVQAAAGNIVGPSVTPATVATNTNPHANYAN